jgi:hypothetical protein
VALASEGAAIIALVMAAVFWWRSREAIAPTGRN